MAVPLKIAFATYPSVKLKGFKKDAKSGEKKFVYLKELLFGDYLKPYLNGSKYETITITEGRKEVTYIKVRARGVDGYLKESEFQAERILEVNFVDVGQGDGCHIVTPDDKHFIIDAGASVNMYSFLKWRYNIVKSNNMPPPFTVVVSHSDADHYKGFAKIFDLTSGAKQQFRISKIFHNGMIEASGSGLDSLGTVVDENQRKYITGLCITNADYNKRVKNITKPGAYITILNKSTATKQSLNKGSELLYKQGNMTMDIMAPVVEEIGNKNALRVLGSNKGKTKNGHSVVIRLTIGKMRLMLGGDLNTEAEYYLLQHYSGVDIQDLVKQLNAKNISEAKKQDLKAKLEEAILFARKELEVEIAKSCHHGSSDFSSEFLRVLNPMATIISSGDEEPYAHPRPDTLGTIGKHSRGDRSLIFCTELARSGKEFLDLTKLSPAKKRERIVTVYGMINVRTDGEKTIIAQKLERPAANQGWDIHKLEWDEKTGGFEYRM